MTNDERDEGCREFSDDLAELALGILTGRERAATLTHVDSCPRCAEELEQLARTADTVVSVAPDMEPPVGFEVRLFNAMGVTEPADPRKDRPIRWMLAAAAVVVALVVGLSIGWMTGSNAGSSRSGQTPPVGAVVASAVLRDHGSAVGHVYAYGGSRPWLFMTLADSTARGRVTCRIVTTGGDTRTVGAFTVKAGYGAWGAPLPVPADDVVTAQVVSPSGTVLGTAPLS
jgi:Putative zinc-finger